ncbi:PucR family transcriptional regulator ligand-binding domain-containing protein [Terribacillus saccharophilus]|uniref:PucR family transcriptional regulator n=1 Tax=Terribacillus saccharophilus TaxID=361277 RepID=UPI003981BF28
MELNNPGISLDIIMDLSVFKDAKLISGHNGVKRIVRYVDILEVPELKGWGREGEMLLTTGYAFKDTPAKLEDLLKELIRVQAAALVIKTDRYIGQLSQSILDLSDSENFPIIQLPNDVPYIDVTHEVLEHILQKQSALLRKSDKMYRNLTKLVINNDDTHSVAVHVSSLLQAPIWVLDEQKRILVASHEDTEPSPDAHIWKIAADRRHMGYLAVLKEELDELDSICIEQAKMAFSLKFLQRQVQQDTEKKMQGDFLQELLSGVSLTDSEIIERSRQFEISPDWTYKTLIFRLGSQTTQASFLAALDSFRNKLTGAKPMKSFVLNNGHSIILIVSAPDVADGDINACLEAFVAEWKGLRVGLGRNKNISQLSESYVEAKQALEIGVRLHAHNRIYDFYRYEYFHLLSQAYNHNWKEIIEERIGGLIQHDNEKGTEFIHTLFHYLDTNKSLMETASRMYIHRNSVKYRIDKIKDITAIPFETELDKLGYYMAIALYLIKRGS